MPTRRIAGGSSTHGRVSIEVTSTKDGMEFIDGRKPNVREVHRIVEKHAKRAHREVVDHVWKILRADVVARVGLGPFYNSLARETEDFGERSIHTSIFSHNRQLADWLERGTGIYGPRHRVIRPKRGRFLKIPLDRIDISGQPWAADAERRGAVFSKTVAGQRPKHFFRDAARAGKIADPEIQKKHAAAAAAELRIRKP